MQTNIQQENKWHIILGGTIGNVTEWYNFLLYGYLADVMAQLFFPTQNQLLSLILTFTIFAISFFMRPLGGILFGWIGDTYGRQRALIIATLTMTVPTLLIGGLPTYASIGLASPILLCIFRILQGLSAGGEHTGSAIYLAEHALPARRAFWVSMIPTSAALGVLISSTMAFLIVESFTDKVLLAWGWRVGYWIGTLFCFISIFLRLYLPETPHFQNMRKIKLTQRHPLSELIKDFPTFKNLLLVFCLASSWGIFYQILFIWMPTYLTRVQNLTDSLALKINSFYMLFFVGLILCVGYCADYLNRKWLLMSACFAMLILAYPLFSMLSSGMLWQVYVAMGIFTLVFSIYLPTAFISMIELFRPEIRYTGLSFGFNIGLAIFGGTCPLVATWLIEVTGNTLAPAFYIMLAAISAFLAAACMQSKKDQPLSYVASFNNTFTVLPSTNVCSDTNVNTHC